MATYKQVGYGSQGSDVMNLQKLLNQNGYTLDEDGIFGDKTRAAVKDYQQKNKLAVDGIVGNNTWGALTASSPAAGTTPSTDNKAPEVKNQSYQESDAVKQAQAMLQQQLAQKPGAYQSQWQTQLNDAINKILNREPFSYDLNGDALYQQYKDKYVVQGQQAMMDTMGQAQAMTGGYGNSYAQSVGQQAYQSHLQQLNDRIPELYQLALNKYQMEGDQMYDQAALIAQMEDKDYGRYRDKVADSQWKAEFDEAKRRYDQEYAQKYGSTGDTTGGSGNGGGGKYDANTAKIQQELRDAGYNIVVDGIWGPKTQAAYDDYKNGGGGKLPDPTSTANTTKIINSHMTKQEALRRGITAKEYDSMVIDWINHANLTDGEVRYLLQHYGLE